MKSIIFVLCLLLPGVAFAKQLGGAGAASSAMKSGTSLYGMCSQDDSNAGSRWVMNDSRPGTGGPFGPKSFCDEIDDTISTQKSCNREGGDKGGDGGKTLAEQLRTDPKFIDSLKEACGGNVQKTQAIAGDQTKFNLFLKQLFSVLAIQENTWDSNPVSSMGAKGLMQLDKDSVKGYAKCSDACKELGKSGDFKSAKGDHLTMQCGVTIGLYWMAKDHVMGEGSGNKGSKGLARYYQPFRKIDKDNRTWMMAKMKNYCDNRIDKDSPASKPGNGGDATTMNEYWPEPAR